MTNIGKCRWILRPICANIEANIVANLGQNVVEYCKNSCHGDAPPAEKVDKKLLAAH